MSMLSIEELKDVLERYREAGIETEVTLEFEDKIGEYMIIQYLDKTTSFQRLGSYE